ncbi:MAG: hypothetical protein EOP04_24955 [Proteobacteria bacterium]|nr:MAG: hypothetical protein EOP04_24955 [Pseudomonadota bacterium]
MSKKISASLLKNEKGQFVIEAVLLMVMSVGLLVLGLRVLRDGNVMSNLVSGPWERMSGMIESGNWDTAAKAAAKHPNQRNRLQSVDPR